MAAKKPFRNMPVNRNLAPAKIRALNFEICPRNFKICQTYFFLSPGGGKKFLFGSAFLSMTVAFCLTLFMLTRYPFRPCKKRVRMLRIVVVVLIMQAFFLSAAAEP